MILHRSAYKKCVSLIDNSDVHSDMFIDNFKKIDIHIFILDNLLPTTVTQ